MAKLILKQFSCVQETNEGGSDGQVASIKCNGIEGRTARSARSIAACAVTALLLGAASLPLDVMAGTFNHINKEFAPYEPGTYYGWVANCPPGQKVVSGGWESRVEGIYGTGLRVISSRAFSSSQWGWTVVNEGSMPVWARMTMVCYKP
jgi:hypothetical protein